MQEPQVQSLGQEDSLEKEMATHSSILAWKIPWTVEPGELQSMGLQELDRTEQPNHHHCASQWQPNVTVKQKDTNGSNAGMRFICLYQKTVFLGVFSHLISSLEWF